MHGLAERMAAEGTLLVLGHHVDNLERGYGGPPDWAVLHDPGAIASWIPALQIDRADEVLRTVQTDLGPRTAVDSLVVPHRSGTPGD